ncbi:hypothetical protein [Nitrospina gracilis]|uniref:hypothetical protein n=1 Tax=Nitrospina gracilis TaxID=35801 RepID=UPI001F3C21A4|nr:hypothetical protein [Nitrospina gracilis]MCF8721457.1 DNA repair exonuclease SbcCD ATPase subunit [Nitrospina gracilis Nb-211]
MKTKPLIIFLTALFVLFLFGSNGFAQLFGGGDVSDEQIHAELKKLNTRIVENLFPELAAVKKAQSQLVEQMNKLNEITLKRHNQVARQVDLLNSSLASLQGSIEQNQVINQKANVKLDDDITRVKTQMNSLEAKLTGDLKNQFAGQIEALNRQAEQQKVDQQAFMKNLENNFQALQKGLAQDMDRIGQAQEQRIGRAVTAVTEMANLQKQNSQVMTSGFQTLNKHDENILAGVSRMEVAQKSDQEKNKKLIDILSDSLKQQQTELIKLDEVAVRQQGNKQDIELTRETMKKLKEIVDKRLTETAQTQEALRVMNQQLLKQQEVIQSNLLVSDEKMNKLAAGLQSLDSQNAATKQQLDTANQKLDQVRLLNEQIDGKFIKLVDTTKSMLTGTAQVSEKMDAVSQKIDAGRTEANLSNEKLSKLVEILKTIAQEQDKLAQVLGNQNQINQNIQTVTGSLNETHKEFRDRLEDLRRKGNVAIARGDDILKLLQK